MIQCDLVLAPATARDYLCRAKCGRSSRHILKARGYTYSYPCCSEIDCVEKVRSVMEEDIERAAKKGYPVKEPKLPPWRWISEDGNAPNRP